MNTEKFDNTDRDDAREPMTARGPFEEAMTKFFSWASGWPASLPPGLQYGILDGIDEHEMVLPSWNAIPLREVVRAGRTVAVVDTSECVVVTVISVEEFPTEEDARAAFGRIYDKECAAAQEEFEGLPDELKVGAALPEGDEARGESEEWLEGEGPDGWDPNCEMYVSG